MKIINKIAVEPESLSSWERFRYVMEKLGFSNGLVLAKFPKRWPKLLLERLNVGDIERQKIVTKLQKYKSDRMVSSGMLYQSDLSWVDNIMNKVGRSDIEKVLVSEVSTIVSPSKSISALADADEEFFEVSREVNVLNTPEQLSTTAESLLGNTSLAIFIDPYLRLHSTSSYLDTFGEFADIAAKWGKCKAFILYTHSKYIPHDKGSEIDQAFNKKILPKVQPEFRIVIRYVNDSQSEHPLHARYLLTEKGGLRYDKGFQPGRPPVYVDISLLDTKMYKVLFERFANTDNDYQIDFEYIWCARKTTL